MPSGLGAGDGSARSVNDSRVGRSRRREPASQRNDHPGRDGALARLARTESGLYPRHGPQPFCFFAIAEEPITSQKEPITWPRPPRRSCLRPPHRLLQHHRLGCGPFTDARRPLSPERR